MRVYITSDDETNVKMQKKSTHFDGIKKENSRKVKSENEIKVAKSLDRISFLLRSNTRLEVAVQKWWRKWESCATYVVK